MLWSFDTVGILLGSPLVVDGMVYFGSGDGWVYALPVSGPVLDDIPVPASGSSLFPELVRLTFPKADEGASRVGWGFGPTVVAASSDGSTLVLGDPVVSTVRTDGGAAFVITKPSADWGELNPEVVGILLPPEPSERKESVGVDYVDISGSFGQSVAVSGYGRVVVIGVPDAGAVYVFIRPETGWNGEVDAITLLPGVDESSRGFGESVAVSSDGRFILAGFRSRVERSSMAYVFTMPAGGWSESAGLARLTTLDGYQRYGREMSASISLDGSTVVLGVPDLEAVYVFDRPGSEWADVRDTARLVASDRDWDDRFGQSVAVSSGGGTVVVGSPEWDSYSEQEGAAYLFTRPISGWTDVVENAVLTASDGGREHFFGASVAVARGGDRVVVLAPSFGSPLGPSAVYLFALTCAYWNDQSLPLMNSGRVEEKLSEESFFGSSVAFGEDVVAFGGIFGDAYVLVPAEGDESLKWLGSSVEVAPPVSGASVPSPTLLWSHDVASPVWGTQVADGRVYARSEDIESEYFALSAATGEQLWVNRGIDRSSFNPHSPPVAAGGSVYVLGRDWVIQAVDGVDGDRLQRFTRGERAPSSTPAVVDGVLYGGSSDGYIRSFDVSTGAPIWSSEVGKLINYSPPVVSGGVLYAGVEDGGLHALDASNGNPLWKFLIQDGSCDLPVVGGNLLLCAASVSPSVPLPESGMKPSGLLHALDASTGELVWAHDSDAMLGTPAVADGAVYFISDDGYVQALRLSDGQELWRQEMTFLSLSAPAVADGVLYIGSRIRSVYALDASTGASVWKYRTDGDVAWSPVVADGVVYVAGVDGQVYALSTSSVE